MYVKSKTVFLIVLVLVAIPFIIKQQANAIGIDTSDLYYNDNGLLIPYKLSQTSNAITVLTKDGSYVLNKNDCTLAFYNTTSTSGTPTIPSIGYSVLASQGNSGVWNPVSIINNAACIPTITQNHGTITLTGAKTVSGAGTFQVNYTKVPLQPLKITYSATNNNPSWTNYHIGLADTIQTPRFVNLGNQTYDLSQYNNTVLSRTWITNHNAQLVRFTSNAYYNMGLGWNNANDITIHYINNQASITIDYTYNTPILSPGQTITVDPSIAKDASNAYGNAGAASTYSTSMTVSSNSSRLLLISVAGLKTGGVAPASIVGVQFNGVNATKIPNTEQVTTSGGTEIRQALFALKNPSTGTHTLQVQFATTVTESVFGWLPMYNVDQSKGVWNGNSTFSNSVTQISLVISPNRTGSWIFSSSVSASRSGAISDTQDWSNIVTDPAIGQHRTSPTIGSKNYMYFGSGAGGQWTTSGVEILQANTPSTPTITAVNTLNSTAMQVYWSTPTGATGFLVYRATPYTGTYSLIANQTTASLITNGLTAGSQYGFKITAYNASGSGASNSTVKSNYTKNIAPTSPTMSSITNNTARVTVTNPSGNFSGYQIYQVQGNGVNYTLAGTSSNTTNHFDLTGLNGNTKHTVKLATRYAVGTNSSGVSSNSTTVTFYTLPNPPKNLLITQSLALVAHLNWSAAGDNGTQLGYKIEQSINSGGTWSTVISNTGNTTTHADIVESSIGKYFFRVSSIKYGGTSPVSNPASRVIWSGYVINIHKADNATIASGNIYQSNSTSLNNIFSAPLGTVSIPGITGNQNFTFKDSATLFVTKKQYNTNATSSLSLNMITNDFYVDCSYTGTGTDFELFTNGTTNHIINSFTSPVCYTNNTMKWKVYWAANGNSIQNDTSTVRIQVLNNTFGMNPTSLTANGTTVTTAYAAPWIISNSFTVGSGVKNYAIYFSANMALNPAYIPTNYTAGSLNVTGSNNNIQPIQITSAKVGSDTVVTFTYPTTYTLGVNANMILENKTATFTGLSRTVVDAAHVSSSITFKNASNNDIIKIKAYDINSGNNANYSLSMNSGSIPLLTQIANFRNGTYGTHGQFGSLDLIVLIVLIFSMIGLNRVSETVGLIFNLVVIGGFSFYGILPFDKTIYAGIAMLALIIVGSTKKLPWS